MSDILILFYVVITSTISGATGMAGGVILMAIFTGVMPLSNALILHGITQFTSNGFRALLNYKDINYKIVVPYLFGAALSYGLLYFINVRPTKGFIYFCLGVMPFVSLVNPLARLFDITKRGRSFLCGALVSLSQTMAGVSGGVLDLFFITGSLDRFSIVATKSFTQALGHGFKIIFYIYVFKMEMIEVSRLSLVICLFAPFLGGLFGKMILRKFSDKIFIRIVKFGMICMGISLIYKGL